MFAVAFGATLAATAFLAWTFLSAPYGHEDEAGFHFDDEDKGG